MVNLEPVLSQQNGPDVVIRYDNANQPEAAWPYLILAKVDLDAVTSKVPTGVIIRPRLGSLAHPGLAADAASPAVEASFHELCHTILSNDL